MEALSDVAILINSYEDVYPLFKQGAAKGLASYKVHVVCVYCCVRVNTVQYGCLFS